MTNQYSQSPKRFLIVGAVLVLSLLITATVLAALPQDTTIADFQSGTVGSCYVGPSTWDGNVDGEVILSPTIGEVFSGTVVPAAANASPLLSNVTLSVVPLP